MNLINFFLRSKFFDKINSFLARKIFKLLKIFFIETYLSSLPKINYPLKNIETDLFNSKKFLNTNSIPYMSYPQLPHLVQIMYEKQNNLTFFDYGAGNLSLYNYLNRTGIENGAIYYPNQIKNALDMKTDFEYYKQVDKKNKAFIKKIIDNDDVINPSSNIISKSFLTASLKQK